ncbi:dTDP-4-dehydrorhamnose 3,5-epimerase [bacterium]|nr:dTDP-4-dehydrorhamnose 3,5-epimerase [bacterium]
MNINKTNLDGVFVIETNVFSDLRGYFMETYNQKRYSELNLTFVQDNFSHSQKGTLRGLHYQLKNPQDKLVCVLRGEIFDVAVDIRQSSENFGKWFGTILSSENHKQIIIPKGFAHGFCVLSDEADVLYKCTDFYTPGDEFGILWSDPELKIDWKIKEPLLSAKDEKHPGLSGNKNLFP